MAKGNDGNLLQHAVEVEAAWYLCVPGEEFSVMLTHGMKPSEPLGKVSTTGLKLDAILGCAAKLSAGVLTSEGQPTIVRAYAGVNATRLEYPNSARLLVRVASMKHAQLVGTVCETVREKIEALKEEYNDSRVRIVPHSWRQALRSEPQPNSRWLVSMDPMSFIPGDKVASDHIGGEDILAVAQWCKSLLGQEAEPGLVAIFCYSMSQDVRRDFAKSVHSAFQGMMPSSPPNVAFIAIAKNSADHHVAALVSRDHGLLRQIKTSLERIPLRLEPHDLDVPNYWERSS